LSLGIINGSSRLPAEADVQKTAKVGTDTQKRSKAVNRDEGDKRDRERSAQCTKERKEYGVEGCHSGQSYIQVLKCVSKNIVPKNTRHQKLPLTEMMADR
jgi:hypothetical protein